MPYPLEIVDDLLTVLASRRPYLESAAKADLHRRQIAAGALVAMERQLQLLRLAHDHGMNDAIGPNARVIWELWCVGMNLILGDQADHDHAKAAYEWAVYRIARDWPEEETNPAPELLEGDPPPAATLIYSNLERKVAKRLEALHDPGPVSYRGINSHSTLYRFESTYSAHGNFGLAYKYVDEQPDVGRHGLTIPDAEYRLRALGMSAIWIAQLAYFVYREFGVTTHDVEHLLVRLMTPPPDDPTSPARGLVTDQTSPLIRLRPDVASIRDPKQSMRSVQTTIPLLD